MQTTILTLGTAALLMMTGCQPGIPPAEKGDPGGEAAHRVVSSGKTETALAAVPGEVLAAAQRAKPGMTIVAAEYETRNGREYYDIGGFLPNDAEVELDMSRIDGRWTVVEIQRDIGYPEVPAPVLAALAEHAAGWQAERIIESDQGDGTVVYEFFGAGPDGPVKHEVKWSGGAAEFLVEEWLH